MIAVHPSTRPGDRNAIQHAPILFLFEIPKDWEERAASEKTPGATAGRQD